MDTSRKRKPRAVTSSKLPDTLVWQWCTNRPGHILGITFPLTTSDAPHGYRLVIDIKLCQLRIERFGTGEVLGSWVEQTLKRAMPDDFANLRGTCCKSVTADAFTDGKFNLAGCEMTLLRKLAELQKDVPENGLGGDAA